MLKRSCTMTKVWSQTMKNGVRVPGLGLGTSHKVSGEVGPAIEAALKAGYRHLDCAHIYMNEAEIGETLQKCFREGVCKREDLFITSKLWRADYSKEKVQPALELTLKNLHLDYLDLYLVHAPFSYTDSQQMKYIGYDAARIGQVWEGMEELVAKGLTRAIGISNFSITKTENLLKTAKIVPAVNQVECHPYFQQPKLQEYCQSKGIVVMAYAPLGSPARKQGITSDRCSCVSSVGDDPVINEIATKKGATPAQICISFLLHRGFVVIPKSVNPKRILENYKATEVSLSEEEIQRLVGINKNQRLFTFLKSMPKGTTVEQAFDVEEDENFIVGEKLIAQLE